MPPSPPFAAVVFDNDGLLMDTEVVWTVAEERFFTQHGKTFTQEHKKAIIGSSGDRAARLLAEWLDRPQADGPGLLKELQVMVLELAREPCPMRPGAEELIAGLTAAGIPIAVASNSEREFVERVLGNAGLLGEGSPFGAVVSASDVAEPKPAPDVYLEAARRLGVDPARCAALEDSQTGADAAKAAGMFLIGVPYFPEHSLEGPDLQASSLGDASVSAALLGVAASAS